MKTSLLELIFTYNDNLTEEDHKRLLQLSETELLEELKTLLNFYYLEYYK